MTATNNIVALQEAYRRGVDFACENLKVSDEAYSELWAYVPKAAYDFADKVSSPAAISDRGEDSTTTSKSVLEMSAEAEAAVLALEPRQDGRPHVLVRTPTPSDRSGGDEDEISQAKCRLAQQLSRIPTRDISQHDRDIHTLMNACSSSSPSQGSGVIAPADYQQKLAAFLEALDEWGCEDSRDRAQHILEFQRTGYDLDAYLVEHPDRAKSELN